MGNTGGHCIKLLCVVLFSCFLLNILSDYIFSFLWSVTSFKSHYSAAAFNISLFIAIKPSIQSSILLISSLCCYIFRFFSADELCL